MPEDEWVPCGEERSKMRPGRRLHPSAAGFPLPALEASARLQNSSTRLLAAVEVEP
jgi:hypothetical protein